MRLQDTQDTAATALWGGHDASTMEEHYRGIATPDDAKRFYALRPKAGIVVAMTGLPADESATGEPTSEEAQHELAEVAGR